MKLIDVVTYSGHRGEERPIAFILDGERIEISEILDKRIEEAFEDRTRKSVFKVKGSDGYTHVLFYDEHTLEWFHE